MFIQFILVIFTEGLYENSAERNPFSVRGASRICPLFFFNYARYARADGPTEETRNDGFPEIYQGL